MKKFSDLLEQKRSERKESVDQMMESVKKIFDEHHVEYRIKREQSISIVFIKRWSLNINVLMNFMI